MLQNEIVVGGEYVAKVSGKLTTLVVEKIETHVEGNLKGRRKITSYVCRNKQTGREVVCKSAARFRQEIRQLPLILTEELVQVTQEYLRSGE